MRGKIVIRRENFCADQLLLQDIHELQQIFRMTVADVIQPVRGQRQAVLTVLPFRSTAHYAGDALRISSI
jgi:hypothetical protein